MVSNAEHNHWSPYAELGEHTQNSLLPYARYALTLCYGCQYSSLNFKNHILYRLGLCKTRTKLSYLGTFKGMQYFNLFAFHPIRKHTKLELGIKIPGQILDNTGGFLFIFFLHTYVLYSTLVHLPPLRFHCVGGC